MAGSTLELYRAALARQRALAAQVPVNAAANGFEARDNMRRLVRRAMGRDSTVRTGAGGAPYSGAPKMLLGS